MFSIVPGIGPPGARIAFVGEAPGEEEVREGLPFVGPSGKMLNLMLQNVGIDRNSCYITNVVKQRPPNNDFGVFYQDTQRAQPSPLLLQSIESLKAELCRIKPNIVVPLGGEAFRALTGKVKRTTEGDSKQRILSGPIMQWRGSLLTCSLDGRQQKVCSTLHPAHVLRQYRSRVIVEKDLRRVSEESLKPSLVLPSHDFLTRPSFQEVVAFLREPHERLAFDIETSGPFVRCLGFSDRKDRAICIPFMANFAQSPMGELGRISLFPASPQRNSYWPPEQEFEIIRLLAAVFGDSSIAKIAQNFPFDSLVLARDFGLDCSPGFSLDTMVAHHTCFSELPKGLDYLASVYTRVPYYSDFDSSVDEQEWTYNCYDCAVTMEIADALEEELASCNQLQRYKDEIHPAILAYTRAETRGILIDRVQRDILKEKTKGELEILGTKIISYSQGSIKNPNSDQQIKEFLYGTLKLKPILHHKTRQPTSDKHAREKLRQRNPEISHIFDDLDEYSSKSTLLSGFLDRDLGTDGRIRTHYNVSGTVTGRLSSSEPLFDIGTNLQNIPRGAFRRIFLADNNWSLVKADLSQAEWLIVAFKAPIPWVIEKYTSDPSWKIHRWVASQVFGKPESEVQRKLPDGQSGLSEYDLAKNGLYGTIYGMSYGTAAITWKVPFNTAKYMLDSIHRLFPEIRQRYWAWIKEQLACYRKITNPLGRTRIFLDRFDENMERDARSDFAQSTVGNIINRAFVRVDREWDDQIAYPLLQVHDEIVAHVRDEHAVEYAHKLREAMTMPLDMNNGHVLTIPVEVSVGKNWYETVEVK